MCVCVCVCRTLRDDDDDDSDEEDKEKDDGYVRDVGDNARNGDRRSASVHETIVDEKLAPSGRDEER